MDITVQHETIDGLLADPVVTGLLESVSDGALVIDVANRKIAAMNARARGLLGYRRRDALGCQCQKLMNSPACSLACPLTALLEGRSEEGELELYYRGRRGDQFLQAHTRMLLIRGSHGKPLAGIELFRDLREVNRLKKAMRQRANLHGIIGKAAVMQTLYEQVEQVAPYDIPVLITGESGVGKERFADAIHHHSRRSEKAFLKINCAALSSELAESELFGHRRGAFTGAGHDRRGYFEEADGGTLLLDEIGELPIRIQAKLLRVLQEGEIQRVGEDRVRRVDIRIIAATNRPLEEEIAAGGFRQDLYYRLLGARLHVPPLRERREDIPLLADRFVAQFGAELQKNKPGPLELARETYALLLARQWPGNVRELKNVLRLAAIRGLPDGLIKPSHIAPPPVREPFTTSRASLDLAELERAAIDEALDRCGGNASAAARLLGINRSTLWRKLRKES